jgi:hypothetical protein
MARTRRIRLAWARYPHAGRIDQAMPYLRVRVETQVLGRDTWTYYVASAATHRLFASQPGMVEARLHGREGTLDLDPASVIFAERRADAETAAIHAVVDAFLRGPFPTGPGTPVPVHVAS